MIRTHIGIRCAVLALVATAASARAQDVSPPAMLQWFEGSWQTIEKRQVDVWKAGYGSMWTPPPGRADQGNLSVGYDPYDRFDLGSTGNSTLYGTETGLKSMVAATHRWGGRNYLDLVWNHNGYSTSASVDGQGHSFTNAGGYPGFVLSASGAPDGDFHAANASGDWDSRVAGLIDIDQTKNFQLVRSPVPGFANNIPAGAVSAFGRLANTPQETNRRFYPDQQSTPITVFDPSTNESNIPIYSFNTANPQTGDPVTENGLGYLMRNTQWMVQSIGADGFRIDAEKHMPQFVMGYLDRAVFRAIKKPLLDGSTQNVFSFGEIFDGNKAFVQTYIRKDINPATPGVVGGNRDSLDFPLFFGLQNALTSNGLTNNWNNIVNASQDSQDDGLANNGSQGVMFTQSHDTFGPYLMNVAYAYTLMRPGNAVVYFNAKEFGAGRDFPKDGKIDALGGFYGSTITRLVDIRNRYGTGNYTPRILTKELLGFERDKQLIVGLNNRIDNGYDAVTSATNFPAGTFLIELTGNAADSVVDPNNDIPELLTVNPDKTVNFRIPRNKNVNGVEHDKGYVVYGLSGPQGSMTLSNVAQTIAGETPTASTNGTARLSAIKVVKADTFSVTTQTNPVFLLGSIRDVDADGDNALLRIDGGIDVNATGAVDFVAPGSATYGFEQFITKNSPLIGGGDGQFIQNIDATKLSEGMHFVEVRAFRHRTDGGPSVYTSFKEAVYIDRLKPVSAVDNFNPIVAGVNENRRFTVRSTDFTADNVHVFMDLPAALTDAQVLAMVGSGSQANRVDRDVWWKDFTGVSNGNHVATLVTYELDGTTNVQRLAGFFTSTIFGAGLGDLNFDNTLNTTDINLFSTLYSTNNTQFNPAADFNADGLITAVDVYLLGPKLAAVGAGADTMAAYNQFVGTLPEPTSLTIFAIAGLALAIRNGRK